ADFLEIFSPKMLWTTFWTSMLSIGAQGGYYAIMLWLPVFLAERGLTVPRSGRYLALLIAGSGVGYLVSAWLSDIIGRRRNFRLFAVCAFGIVFFHSCILRHEIPSDQIPGILRQILTDKIPGDDTIILWLALPLGFFASGAFAGMGAFFTELFPTRMRGSGVGFSYNFGRGFAALILWLIPWLAGLVHGFLTPPGLSIGLSIGVFVLT